MSSAEYKLDVSRQPANETIDRLSFTIQRQSAMCMEFVHHAIEEERRQCVAIAEAEANSWPGSSHESGHLVAERIAEKIRARAGRQPMVATLKSSAAG